MILDHHTARRVRALLTGDLGGAQLVAEYRAGWRVPGGRAVTVTWLRDGAVAGAPYAIRVRSETPEELPVEEYYALFSGFCGAYSLSPQVR